jgi:hypothetical protein
MLPNSFYETRITPIPKSDKDTTKKENYKPISLISINIKILNKCLETRFKDTLKRSYNIINLVSFQECKNGLTHKNQYNA